MKATTLSTSDFAEFGRSETVVLVLTINTDEAAGVAEDMRIKGIHSCSAGAKMQGIMEAIAAHQEANALRREIARICGGN